MEDQVQQLSQQLQALAQHYQESMQYNATSYETIQALAPHIQRYQAMETLMTDADRLAEYTNNYFTYVQPLPERPNAAPLVRPEFPAMPVGMGNEGQPRLAEVHPALRWQIADQLDREGAFRQKVLIAGVE